MTDSSTAESAAAAAGPDGASITIVVAPRRGGRDAYEVLV
jgi:hypothetical protein